MTRNRNYYLMLSLSAMVLASAGLFFFSREENRSPLDRDYFKIKESEKIDRITIQSSRGNVELKFENNRWRVNEKWDADMQMIKVLMATLRQVEPRRPVAANMKDSIRQLLNQSGTQVALFESGIAKMEFLAVGNRLKTDTWFSKKDDDQPYVMMIPGYRVFIAGILELDESGWRNKRIFDFNWRNFKSLKCVYPGEPRQSFEIELQNRYFGIRNMEAVDTTKLNDYLDAVSLLVASRFVPLGQRSADSLATVTPAVRIEVGDIGSRLHQLELFTPRRTDAEVYGRLANGEFVTLNRDKVGEIVRRREFFIAGNGR